MRARNQEPGAKTIKMGLKIWDVEGHGKRTWDMEII